MVPKLTCQECLDFIHECSLEGGHSLELSARLPARVHTHLQECPGCRQACPQSLRLESRLRNLRQELPSPDMRASVMTRLRQGQRLPIPRLASPPITSRSSGVREMALATLALTIVLAAQGPQWLGQLSLEGLDPRVWLGPCAEWLATLYQWTLDLSWPAPELWGRSWDTPLLVAALATCAAQTRRWLRGQHG